MKFKQSVVGPKGQLHHHKVPAVSDLHLSAGTESTLSELTITRQLGAQSARRTRLKQVAVLALFVIGLIVCVSSLSCILLLPQFVTNQIAKVSNKLPALEHFLTTTTTTTTTTTND